MPPATPSYRGGKGEPMILIHGFTDTWETWKRVLPELETRHEVFAPTLPGHHGGSPWRAGAALTDHEFADALERQLDEAGIDRAHLVGNSLGGWLALVLGSRGRALSVTAICPAGGWERGGFEDRRIRLLFGINELANRTGSWWMDPMAARPRLRRFALRQMVAPQTRVTAVEARGLIRGAASCEIFHETLARGAELFGEIGPIDARVRILYGTRDQVVRWPSCYPRLRRLLPQAEFVALDGMGHLAMWDDPPAVARRILEVSDPR
jgi:pimeloyl-ACP methyl ester carboxylesterase